MVRHWIDICTETHLECQTTVLYRPRRLLKLLATNRVQLIETTSHVSDELQYVALSHCWGPNGMSLRLVKETVEELSAPFNHSLMPPNLRDAVEFTRSMGYAYIWIDSLCIIQDCPDDTRTEILAMSEIYSNAIFTLAATASESPEGGCFRDRVPAHFRNCELLGSKVSYDYIAPQQNISIDELFARDVENAPLNQRAWTFQERLLSRRVIHFCESVVTFECGNMCASEWHREGIPYPRNQYVRLDGRLYSADELKVFETDHPEYINESYTERLRVIGRSRPMAVQRDSWVLNPQHTALQLERERLLAYSARTGLRGALEMLQTLPRGLSQAEKLECHRRWFELVQAYSGRSLTFRSDRLRALAGLIELISRNTGMVNIAGLWEATLAFDLLWAPTKTENPPSGLPMAPSWSWVSVNGQVESILTLFKAAHEGGDAVESISQIHVETELRRKPTPGPSLEHSLHVPGHSETADKMELIIRGPFRKSMASEDRLWMLDNQGNAIDLHSNVLMVYSEPSETDPVMKKWAGLLIEPADDGADAAVFRRIGSVVAVSPSVMMADDEWEVRTIVLI
jgi:hypothetical protein